MILPRDTLMSWNGNKVTEHNRGPISVEPLRIERAARMIDGTLRKNVVATKNTYSIEWSMVPSLAGHTVDGYWGGKDILDFGIDTTGSFTLTLRYDDANGSELTKTVVFSSPPSYEVIFRSTAGYDLVNVSVELEEV